MRKIKIRNMFIRTVKTFVAAFLSSVATILPAMTWAGYDTWQAAVVAIVAPSVAAGITAIFNLPPIKKFFRDYGEKPEKEGE